MLIFTNRRKKLKTVEDCCVTGFAISAALVDILPVGFFLRVY